MNYKHLHYFFTVIRTGSIARASEQLHLTPQTLSGQIKELERRLGNRLLRKIGRNLEPTEAGKVVQKYAEEIFSLGDALKDALSPQGSDRWQPAFRVGIIDSVPKSVACHLLLPCMAHLEQGNLVCREGNLPSLLAELAVHKLDLVISDIPMPPNMSVKAFTHLLGKSSVSFFASLDFLKDQGWTLKRAQSDFPSCLAKLSMLLPSPATALRPRIDSWLRQQGLAPRIIGEFDDSALIKAFGRQGLGVFTGPTVLRSEIEEQYRVKCLGTADDLVEEFFAISIERRIAHPAVAAITSSARRELFG